MASGRPSDGGKGRSLIQKAPASYLRNLRSQRRSPLSVAIQTGGADQVRSLLEAGADVNQMGVFCGYGEPPLVTAVRFEQFDIVPILLSFHADVNLVSGRRHSPLIRACQLNHIETITLLLEHGCNPNLLDLSGLNALYWSVKNHNEEAVRMLLEHGASPCQRLQQPEIAHLSMQQRSTALHAAAAASNSNIVKMLLENVTDVNIRDDNDETPLYGAIRTNSFDSAKGLLDKGAIVNIFNGDLRTALHIASANVHQSLDLVQLLLDHDALVNVFDRAHNTPLVLSLRNNFFFHRSNFAVAECLIRHGISLNDPPCQRALEMCIISHGNIELIKMAVSAGFVLNGVEWVHDFVTGPTGSRRQWYSTMTYDLEKEKQLVEYLKLRLKNPHSLMDATRVSIRRHISFVRQGGSIYKTVQRLPLPQSIIMYLLLEN